MPRTCAAYGARVSGGELTTFLVEKYVPELDREAAEAISSRYRNAVRELTGAGIGVRCFRSYAVLEDETYLCVVGAGNADQVVQLSHRAGLVPDHVVPVEVVETDY